MNKKQPQQQQHGRHFVSLSLSLRVSRETRAVGATHRQATIATLHAYRIGSSGMSARHGRQTPVGLHVGLSHRFPEVANLAVGILLLREDEEQPEARHHELCMFYGAVADKSVRRSTRRDRSITRASSGSDAAEPKASGLLVGDQDGDVAYGLFDAPPVRSHPEPRQL